jgi:hypothetical protein
MEDLKDVQIYPCVRCGCPIAINSHAGEGNWCGECWKIVQAEMWRFVKAEEANP